MCGAGRAGAAPAPLAPLRPARLGRRGRAASQPAWRGWAAAAREGLPAARHRQAGSLGFPNPHRSRGPLLELNRREPARASSLRFGALILLAFFFFWCWERVSRSSRDGSATMRGSVSARQHLLGTPLIEEKGEIAAHRNHACQNCCRRQTLFTAAELRTDSAIRLCLTESADC